MEKDFNASDAPWHPTKKENPTLAQHGGHDTDLYNGLNRHSYFKRAIPSDQEKQ